MAVRVNAVVLDSLIWNLTDGSVLLIPTNPLDFILILSVLLAWTRYTCPECQNAVKIINSAVLF